MSFDQVSTNQPALFSGMDAETTPPCPLPVKSARSRNRAAWWRQDLERTAAYLMGQARTGEERAFVEELYEQAVEHGPDFTHYRSKSAFMNAPKLGLDRNAYARILNALDMIERGTYRHCRDKGKQGIPRTVARVLKCLLNLALQYGEVRPSLDGIARLACVAKQTVVNCLKVLAFYGFVEVHRRIKRIPTALGFKVVQDTNAYTIQEPRGLGALAASIFKRASESKKRSASSTEIHSIKRTGQTSQLSRVPDGVYDALYAQWESS
jgi:RNA polymerase-binding transcription factor DksA